MPEARASALAESGGFITDVISSRFEEASRFHICLSSAGLPESAGEDREPGTCEFEGK